MNNISSPKNSRDLSSNFVSKLLNSFNDPNNVLINDEASQRIIENIIFDDYDFIFSNNTRNYIVGGINTELINPILSKYILDVQSNMDTYIDNLYKQEYHILNNSKKTNKGIDENILAATIITSLDKKVIRNFCLHQFLLVYTFQHSENDKHYASVPVSIKIGKKMFIRYINDLKFIDVYHTKEYITYTSRLNKWKDENKDFALCLEDDNLYTLMGCKIIDILTYSGILSLVLTSSADKLHRYHALEVKDKALMSLKTKQSVINLPVKLPMICPPKPYEHNKLGGYLLNDEKFSYELFVEKKGYSLSSVVSIDNKIYAMVNNITGTPFKINQTLLDYITGEGTKHNLLIDVTIKHKFADLDKRTKYQKSVFASHNSKVVLQETILGIADFFRKFSQIYFPVRLDQRGRLYCISSYLNYQSNELSKALLSFAIPGILTKNSTQSVIYLKTYGANCYGGTIAKGSIKSKLEWIDKNIDDIINYDNGTLLKKANDKLLFLSFCIEYKRYYDFLMDENSLEFYTYLPVQLDATCNGFQHMALLSNKETLFKELNLVNATQENGKDKPADDIPPSDFYNFLLHKLISVFEYKINLNEIIDSITKGSYERLHKFIWNRSHIKKSIMTIPYNSTNRSM